MKTTQLLVDLPVLPVEDLQSLDDLRFGRYCYLVLLSGTGPLDFDRWHELAGKVREFCATSLESALQSYAAVIDDGVTFVEVGDTLKERLHREALDFWMRLTEAGLRRLNGTIEAKFRETAFSEYLITQELNEAQGAALTAYRRKARQPGEMTLPGEGRER